ncbi:Uncharacterised protein [Escherichia coli]|uniref:Macro domain-containing protein n=1 Tax=Escherichia coli TaxID=562 RepID=A0A376RKP8_ECOLX|nr:Uncharacterised protein [Escherichia coli]
MACRTYARFLIEENVQSIAIPPLGAGNGGLNWPDVRAQIESALGDLQDVDILITNRLKNTRTLPKALA